MSDSPAPIRSYQRIFRPDRRIYQIDGRRLPLPGGLPLNWLAWAFGALLVVLVLSSRSLLFTLVAGAVAGFLAAGWRGWRGVLVAGALAACAVQVTGFVLGWVDWPLRLLVGPGVIATAAGQLAPDGRHAHRYLLSRAAVRLRAARRSLDRPVMVDGELEVWAPRVWVAPDEHFPVLHHGRVHGPARVVFGREVVLTPRRGRHVARPAVGHRMRAREVTAEVVELGVGQILEIRP
ncbi:MAG: TcpE family conjugal transfer membrane protein [Solirubrobacteraceae bacterium]